MNKNIVKDSQADEISKISSPPSSKNSFRIKNHPNSKKLIEDLLRINEEERKLQAEILRYHNDTKETIADVMEKHRIVMPSSHYFTGKSSKEINHLADSNVSIHSIKSLKDKSAKINAYEGNVEKLVEELASIDAELEKKRQ